MGQKFCGKIVVNAYMRPKESLFLSQRIKEELNKLGAIADIVDNDYGLSGVFNGKVDCSFKDADFVVYLDKDKYLSSELEKAGIRLFNRHAAVRVCDDKAKTVLALSGSGLNIPDTLFGLLSFSSEDEAKPSLKSVGEKLGYPLIVKESFGSMGKGVYLARDFKELKEIFEKVKTKPHLFQKYLSAKVGADVRVIVIGGKAVGAVKRENKSDFRSNVALGGRTEKFDLPEDFIYSAQKAARILGLDYCGVDILLGKNGEPFICEVNSNAFFNGFESATGINVAALYARHIIDDIKNNV